MPRPATFGSDILIEQAEDLAYFVKRLQSNNKLQVLWYLYRRVGEEL